MQDNTFALFYAFHDNPQFIEKCHDIILTWRKYWSGIPIRLNKCNFPLYTGTQKIKYVAVEPLHLQHVWFTVLRLIVSQGAAKPQPMGDAANKSTRKGQSCVHTVTRHMEDGGLLPSCIRKIDPVFLFDIKMISETVTQPQQSHSESSVGISYFSFKAMFL